MMYYYVYVEYANGTKVEYRLGTREAAEYKLKEVKKEQNVVDVSLSIHSRFSSLLPIE